jgi:hypothetical protein
MPIVEGMDAAGTESSKKPKYIVLILLGIGAIIVLIALIYNALFPKAFWQSRELKQNLAKWESQNITHYRMSLALVGYGYDYGYDRMPLTVEVTDNKVVSVVDAQGQRISPGKENPFYSIYPQAFTIPGLFTIAHDWFMETPPVINVSYDPTLGYPTSIYVDPYMEPCCQDFTYTVRNLQVLPP